MPGTRLTRSVALRPVAAFACALLIVSGCSSNSDKPQGRSLDGLSATWVVRGPAPDFKPPRSEAPATARSARPDLDTPYPENPPSTMPFGYGVASGDMTSDSVILWTRTTGPSQVVPEIAESADFSNALALAPGDTVAESDFTAKVVVAGLRPGTEYFYRFRSGEDASAIGTFRTAYGADQRKAVTLAFSGDADWKWKPYPSLETLVREKLDFFVFLGDLVYETRNYRGTVAAEGLDDYRWKYRENREPREGSSYSAVPMQELYRAFGQYSIFDNHETERSQADPNGPSYPEGGARFSGIFTNKLPGFQVRMRAFAEYQPVQEVALVNTGDPRTDGTSRFYRSFQWGPNVELFMVDDRSYRDAAESATLPVNSCNRTILGAPQLKWLEDGLLAAKRKQVVWKVVVVSSPIQELGRTPDVGAENDGPKSWAGYYGCERSRLLKFIDDNAINNVVFLTTNNHYTAINNLTYNTTPGQPASPRKPARNAFEVITGPIGALTDASAGQRVNVKRMAQRDADRAIVNVWNGDALNSEGALKGLKQAGLDPIGLESTFPGLDVGSISAQGVSPGTVEPLAFVSFHSFGYATLSFDEGAVTVRVMTMPAVDALALLKPEALLAYEAAKPSEVLRFRARAQ